MDPIRQGERSGYSELHATASKFCYYDCFISWYLQRSSPDPVLNKTYLLFSCDWCLSTVNILLSRIIRPKPTKPDLHLETDRLLSIL